MIIIYIIVALIILLMYIMYNYKQHEKFTNIPVTSQINHRGPTGYYDLAKINISQNPSTSIETKIMPPSYYDAIPVGWQYKFRPELLITENTLDEEDLLTEDQKVYNDKVGIVNGGPVYNYIQKPRNGIDWEQVNSKMKGIDVKLTSFDELKPYEHNILEKRITYEYDPTKKDIDSEDLRLFQSGLFTSNLAMQNRDLYIDANGGIRNPPQKFNQLSLFDGRLPSSAKSTKDDYIDTSRFGKW